MPTVSYDFSEANDFADFVVVDPGNYVFTFKSADASEKSKAGKPKVIVDLIVAATSPANKWAVGGLVRQHWPTTGAASGRFKAFMAALGINPKDKGAVKLEKYYEQEIGARVIKTAGTQLDEAGNPSFFNDLQGMIPGAQMRETLGLSDEDEEEEVEVEVEDDEEEVEEDVEEEEDEEDDEENEEEESDEEPEGDEEEEEEGWTLEELKKLSLKELKAVAEENDISVKPPKGKPLTAAILVKRLSSLMEDDEEGEEEDPF